jgi:hypothetical protein
VKRGKRNVYVCILCTICLPLFGDDSQELTRVSNSKNLPHNGPQYRVAIASPVQFLTSHEYATIRKETTRDNFYLLTQANQVYHCCSPLLFNFRSHTSSVAQTIPNSTKAKVIPYNTHIKRNTLENCIYWTIDSDPPSRCTLCTFALLR